MAEIKAGRRKSVKSQIYRTGDVGKMLGVSARTAATMFDSHKDITYRIRDDRRVTHDNLLILLAREGITPKHLGLNLSSQLVWIGHPVNGHYGPDDHVTSVIGALYLVAKNEAGAVAVINHDINVVDLMTLTKTVAAKAIKIAAKLPDDVANCARKTDYVWLYHSDNGPTILEVMCWLRDIHLEG